MSNIISDLGCESKGGLEQAVLQLLTELAEGERSAQKEGWLSAEEVRTKHGI
jgi:hypothetical protein